MIGEATSASKSETPPNLLPRIPKNDPEMKKNKNKIEIRLFPSSVGNIMNNYCGKKIIYI